MKYVPSHSILQLWQKQYITWESNKNYRKVAKFITECGVASSDMVPMIIAIANYIADGE